MLLEHALFLRGAQAPRDGLIEIACSAEQTKAGRECALRSLRLLGTSGIPFSVEPLMGLLDDVQMRGSALWALSTQGTSVPAEIFQRYLAEPDDFLHRGAMAGLTAPGRPESRGMLLKALQDENKFVRADAIWALCRLGKDAPVDRIVTMMYDQESFVRKEAVYALRSLGKQAPVAAFLAATTDEDMFVRQTAVDILRGLEETPPVEQMLNLLQQRAEPFTTIAPHSLRLAAIRALERADNPVSMAALRETLEDHDPHVVLAAVEALQHLGEQPSLQSLLTHPALTLPRFRSPLIRAIGKLGEQPMRAALLQSAGQPPVWVQIAAVEVLAECDTVDAAEPLRAALREKHVLVKVAAMAAMSKHQDLRTEIPLDRYFQYLHSQHMSLQGSARRALWTMGPRLDLPIEALLALLELPAGFPLAHVLGDNCQKIPVESVSGLLTSKQPRMRVRAVELLGKRGENAPVDLLVPMLQDEESEVRLIVTQMLGTLGKRIPVEALTQMLQDEDSSVRKTAIEALTKSGEHAPLEALIQALEDEECEVDIAATRALLELKAYEPLWRLVDVALAAEEPERQIDAMIKLIEAEVIDSFATDIPLEPCLRAITHDHKDVRCYAAEILSVLARHGRAISAEPLLSLLDDQDDMTCGSALNALSELTPGVSSDIFLRFLDSERNYPRMCAIRALGRRGEEAPMARLLDFLTMPGRSNQGVRSAAVEACAALGELAPREALVRVLHDEEAHIRWRAGEALKQLGPRIPLDLLEPEVYSNDEVVRRLVLGIIKAGRPDALSRLARAAREKLIGSNEGETNPQHIALFAEAAGFVERPSPALIETLVELLLHADQEVRMQAALALGRLQQPLPDRAWQHLFAMRAETEVSAVRHAATHTLHELLSLESGPTDAFLEHRALQ